MLIIKVQKSIVKSVPIWPKQSLFDHKTTIFEGCYYFSNLFFYFFDMTVLNGNKIWLNKLTQPIYYYMIKKFVFLEYPPHNFMICQKEPSCAKLPLSLTSWLFRKLILPKIFYYFGFDNIWFSFKRERRVFYFVFT